MDRGAFTKIRMTARGVRLQKTTILNVILRPPKDLAVLSCKDTVGLTGKTQVNEIKSVKQPDPSEASG